MMSAACTRRGGTSRGAQRRLSLAYTCSMHASIAQAREAIAALCRRHHIARLEVFGSAARGEDFRPQSDADLLVAFEPGVRVGLDEWDAARRDFETVLGRRVDLVQADAVRNPFVLRQIERERELLYAA